MAVSVSGLDPCSTVAWTANLTRAACQGWTSGPCPDREQPEHSTTGHADGAGRGQPFQAAVRVPLDEPILIRARS